MNFKTFKKSNKVTKNSFIDRYFKILFIEERQIEEIVHFDEENICQQGMIYIEKGTHKIIQSPKYPKKYLPNLNCSWTISTVRDDERVRLHFTTLNIDGKAGDQLILYDGKGTGMLNS